MSAALATIACGSLFVPAGPAIAERGCAWAADFSRPCRALVFVHVGKAGGGSLRPALGRACAAMRPQGAFEVIIRVHEVSHFVDDDGCRWTRPSIPAQEATSSQCAGVTIPGPLYVGPLKAARNGSQLAAGRTIHRVNAAAAARHVKCLRAAPGLLGHALRESPIVIFVRDPVARFVACFNFMLTSDCAAADGSSGSSGGRGRACPRVAQYVARASSVERGAGTNGHGAAPGWRNATDLQLTLEHLHRRARQEGSDAHAATELFWAVPHALASVAWYVGGLGGLARLERRLLFAGTVEAISADFAALERVLARHFGLSAQRLPNTHDAKLGHEHSSASGRARRRLPAHLVAFVREYFVEDYDCIAWLAQRGLVHYDGRGGAQYVESITAAANSYWVEPPLSESDEELLDSSYWTAAL